MYSKLHSDSWLTTLCCWPHMQHGSHSKSSFPDGLRAGFCLSLAYFACYLAACRIVASLTHPLLLDRLKVALQSSQTRSGRPVFKFCEVSILSILSKNFPLMAPLIC